MNIHFSENIKKLRKERNLTQECLADILGVSFQAVSKWERGESYPDIKMLPEIAEFFNVTIDELLGTDKTQREQKIKEEHYSHLILYGKRKYHFKNKIQLKKHLNTLKKDSD